MASTFQSDLLPICRRILPADPPPLCAHYLTGVGATTARDLGGGGLRRLLSESVSTRPLEPLSAEALKRGFTFPRVAKVPPSCGAAGVKGGMGGGDAGLDFAARARAERDAAAVRAQAEARAKAQAAAEARVRTKRAAEQASAARPGGATHRKRTKVNAAAAFLDPAVLAAGSLHMSMSVDGGGDTVTFGAGPGGGAGMAPVDPAAAKAAAKARERRQRTDRQMKSIVERLAAIKFVDTATGVKWGNPFTTVITRKNCAEMGIPDYFRIIVKVRLRAALCASLRAAAGSRTPLPGLARVVRVTRPAFERANFQTVCLLGLPRALPCRRWISLPSRSKSRRARTAGSGSYS